ncbi:MAG: family peptidase [Caulobacter sp.]|nr:family peptidase [Caulobacter sp.]
MRILASLLLACLAVTAARAQGRPFTVEHLLALEDTGHAAFSPDERWLVYETFGPWKDAPSFDHDFLVQQGLGRLFVLDLRANDAPHPLLAPLAGSGDTLGEVSPRGDRVIVFRLRGHRRELGIVTLATGGVVWTGRHVEPEIWNPAALWRNDHEIVALSRAPEAASTLLGRGWQIQARTTAAWSAAARGALSVTPLGAGIYAGSNPPAPTADLIAIDAETGAVRVLTSGGFSDLTLAPGGRTAALNEDAETILPTAATVLGAGFERRRRLVMVDLADGRSTRPCPTCDLLPFVWSWSPDGRQLVAPARQDGETLGQARYWRFSAAGPARRLSPTLAVGEAGGRDKLPLAGVAWPGRDPIVLGRMTAAPRLDWWRMTARGPANLTATSGGGLPQPPTADGADVLLRTSAGMIAVHADGPPRPVSGGRLAPTGPQRAGRAGPAIVLADAAGTRLVDARGAARSLAPLAQDTRILALAPRSGRMLTEHRDSHGVRTLTLRAPDAADRAVATINADLASIAFATPIPIRHEGLDGQPLTSWLYLPPGRQGQTDLPVIVVPYPGARYPAPRAEDAPGELKFDANVQLMAAAGFAVIVPSLPLAPDAEPMPGLAEAMLGVVDRARAAHPQLSATRLAVWGQSYGGYAALAAGIQSPRFGAVIASAAVTNLIARHAALAPSAIATPEVFLQIPGRLAWAETGQGRMGAAPWTDPGRYVRNSPALQIDRMSAPVMLIYGDLDTDASEVQAVFASLYRLGKDAQLLVYRGEHHVVINPANVRDLYARAFDFLRDSLAEPGEDVAAKPAATGPSQ